MPAATADELTNSLAKIHSHFGERHIDFSWRGYRFTSEPSLKGYTKRSLYTENGKRIYSYEWLEPDLEDMHRASPRIENVSADGVRSWINDTDARSGGWVDIDICKGSTNDDELVEIMVRLDEIGCGPVARVSLHAAFSVRQHNIAFRLAPEMPHPYDGVPTVCADTIRVLPSGVLALNSSGGPRLLDVPAGALDQPTAAWLWDAIIL